MIILHHFYINNLKITVIIFINKFFLLNTLNTSIFFKKLASFLLKII